MPSFLVGFFLMFYLSFFIFILKLKRRIYTFVFDLSSQRVRIHRETWRDCNLYFSELAIKMLHSIFMKWWKRKPTFKSFPFCLPTVYFSPFLYSAIPVVSPLSYFWNLSWINFISPKLLVLHFNFFICLSHPLK